MNLSTIFSIKNTLTTLVIILLFCLIVIFSSCSKNNDPVPVNTQWSVDVITEC